jgi:hypothetical protein
MVKAIAVTTTVKSGVGQSKKVRMSLEGWYIITILHK